MERVFDARDFGADGKAGEADQSGALRAALAAAAEAGGGRVALSPGLYHSGPLRLGSGVELRVEAGALLSFIPDFSLYPPTLTRWEGVDCWAFSPLLSAVDARDVALSGAGIVDGSGAAWWNAFRTAKASRRRAPENPEELRLAELNAGLASRDSGGGGRETGFLRPPLVQFLRCSGVRIEGPELRNSPFWNTHLVYCRDIAIRDVRFRNPPDAPNTDGLNLDSCADALIENCEFDVGDDCLGLKSGSGLEAVRVGRPTERVAVRGCVMRAGHGGVVVGSETAGGVRDVEISDCRFLGTDRGLRIKTRRGRGGRVERISMRDCEMIDTLCPVVANCYYGCGGPEEDGGVFSLEAQEVDELTPGIAEVRVERLRATGVRAAAVFAVGLPERPIRGLVLRDCSFSLSPEAADPAGAAMTRGLPAPAGRGPRLRWAEGVVLDGVVLEPRAEAALLVEEGVSFASEPRLS